MARRTQSGTVRGEQRDDGRVALLVAEDAGPPLAQPEEAIFPPALGMIHVHYAGSRRYGMPIPITHADGSPDLRRRATTCGTPACQRGFIFSAEQLAQAFAFLGHAAPGSVVAGGPVVMTPDEVADWANIVGLFAADGVPGVRLVRAPEPETDADAEGVA